ncbi:MAG: hypothetical protein JWQ04_2485 [Pedosphaera sp.]|nr:hypothetical protein [Pedosphaera sp.]
MKKQIAIGGAMLLLAAGTTWGSNDATTSHVDITNDRINADQHLSYDMDSGDLYRDNEFSLDLFGTDALDKHTVDHPSGDRIRHDSRLGLGLGLNYFFIRYVGIGVEAYSEDTKHNFVDNVSGNLILRLPIGQTGLAPYVFGGGGHQFDPVDANFGQAGAGLEFRFCRNFGIFVDGRWVWTDRDRDYGLGRAGVRLAF